MRSPTSLQLLAWLIVWASIGATPSEATTCDVFRRPRLAGPFVDRIQLEAFVDPQLSAQLSLNIEDVEEIILDTFDQQLTNDIPTSIVRLQDLTNEIENQNKPPSRLQNQGGESSTVLHFVFNFVASSPGNNSFKSDRHKYIALHMSFSHYTVGPPFCNKWKPSKHSVFYPIVIAPIPPNPERDHSPLIERLANTILSYDGSHPHTAQSGSDQVRDCTTLSSALGSLLDRLNCRVLRTSP